MKNLLYVLLMLVSFESVALFLSPLAPKSINVGNSLNIGKGETFYVRENGGTSDQCTGKTNVDYPGMGLGADCAFISPYSALGLNGTPSIFKGGDTLIITDGEYSVGLGSPEAPQGNTCSEGYAWDCHMNSIPSGSPGNPSRILGEGYSTGCKTRPKLWGRERATFVLGLMESNWVELQCLEITDKEECGLGKINTAYTLNGIANSCNHNAFPHGNYALNGIQADNSENIYMKNINVHGMASNGFMTGRLANWEMHNVDLSYNSQAGWHGDLAGTAITGYMKFIGGSVNWNGCMESTSIPGKVLDTSCTGQDAGNYSDGLGFNDTGGDWLFKDMEVSYNVQDGLDLLYLGPTGTVIIDNVLSIGNGGNNIKTGNSAGINIIRDSTLIGNCTKMSALGGSFWYSSGTCRAGGHPVSVAGPTLLERTTIYTSGDGAFNLRDRDGQAASIDVRDSIIYIGKGVNIGNGETQNAAFGWNEDTNLGTTWKFSNTILYDQRGYIPTPVTYIVNGVETVLSTICDISASLDPVVNGCVDPGFTEIPSGTDGPGIWHGLETLTIDPSSQFYNKQIGDYK